MGYFIKDSSGTRRQLTRLQFFKVCTSFRVSLQMMATFQRVDHTAGQHAELAFPTLPWESIRAKLDQDSRHSSGPLISTPIIGNLTPTLIKPKDKP